MRYAAVPRMFGVSICLAYTLYLAGGGAGAKPLSPTYLGNVLYCLKSWRQFADYVPPRFEPHSYWVRYMYGSWPSRMKKDLVDADHELLIMVYAPREDSASLFETYLETKQTGRELGCGDVTTYRRERGGLVPDEIPGGLGTLDRIERLRRAIERQPPVRIRDHEVKPGPFACGVCEG